MQSNLWEFIDNSGSFVSSSADKIKTLYFPLANEHLMSSLSPDLHGDIKAGQDAFLMHPVSRLDLTNLKSSRNFWIYLDQDKVWSAAGVSKDRKQTDKDKFNLEAGLLWHKVARENKDIGLVAEVLSFVPATSDAVEVMRVKLTNVTPEKIKFTPTAAIPIYGRSAHNIRDHCHVTSLLQRVTLDKFGVIVKPTLYFNEAGHGKSKDFYFVLGWDEQFKAPQYLYPTQEMFCGEAGDLECPDSVFGNLRPAAIPIQGKEAMGALRFHEITLSPGQSYSYIIVMGVTGDKGNTQAIKQQFRSLERIESAFKHTKDFWINISRQIELSTQDPDFDNWFRWVSIQPLLRKIFGCSFLPDFDYGKGGRGWRDLWQDCLGLILSHPCEVRKLLINNFSGVRIDGSNATIIGKAPGEFIADRNNVSRVWMDHGLWPLFTLDLYIQETADINILYEEAGYFRDHQIWRCAKIDPKWNPSEGKQLKTKKGKVYRGTLLEHVLLQNLVQFLNVGAHNHVRLEGADWNDAMDMAPESGESVTFSAFYAHNLSILSGMLLKLGAPTVKIAKEFKILLKKINYSDIKAKQKLLEEYFAVVSFPISGEKISVDTEKLARSLKIKSIWMTEHIRRKEWLREGFFNGYYDNKKARAEGRRGNIMRMSLVSQVFPIMSGVATDIQIKETLSSANKYLWDKEFKGFRLNTDFGGEDYSLGRAFSFVYGDKENGAFFNHMVVMFAYALYSRGYIEDGWRVLSSIYNMAINTKASKIYPCLPEYFNAEGRGMYSYLTGSGSWFVFTLLTQAFGVKGKDGDLLIEPKLTLQQLKPGHVISVTRNFAGRRLQVSFSCVKKTSASYKILKASFNSQALPVKNASYIIISRKDILKLSKNKTYDIEITLG